MVSAHDLLAIERQKKAQKDQRMTYTDPETVPATSSSLWIIREGEEDLGVARQSLSPRMPPGRQGVRLTNQETVTVVQALWRLAKRRTRRWYRLSYYRVRRTAKQVGRALIPSSSMHLLEQVGGVPQSLSMASPLPRSPEASGHDPEKRIDHEGSAAEQDCGVEIVQTGNIDMIEMTPFKRKSTQDGLRLKP